MQGWKGPDPQFICTCSRDREEHRTSRVIRSSVLYRWCSGPKATPEFSAQISSCQNGRGAGLQGWIALGSFFFGEGPGLIA